MAVEAAPITQCRVCGNTSLVSCIPLGKQHLSSIFPTHLNYRTSTAQWPLELVLCAHRESPPSCGLVQLAHHVDLNAMYQEYPYTSSTNSSMPLMLKEVADDGLALGHLQKGDVILDIGANDGTLLSCFRGQGFKLLGIDPAQNVQPIFQDPHYTHVRQLFSQAVYRTAAHRKAKLITSIAMFYHLNDPVRFSREVAACLDAEGAWIIQMAYLPSMLRTNMYDNIVHEHCGYYAIRQLQWIMEQVGLAIFDVTLNDVYGGSFRVFVKHQGCTRHPESNRYRRLLQEEEAEGLADPATYQAFMGRIEKTREDLVRLCRSVRAQGKSIWVYGASTKGNVILQYCGIGKEEIDAAADANPFKHGKYLIGTDIPIRDEAALRLAKPDYLLVLPYSFVNHFIQRESQLVTQGTRFIVPLPEVHLLPG